MHYPFDASIGATKGWLSVPGLRSARAARLKQSQATSRKTKKAMMCILYDQDWFLFYKNLIKSYA
jgi:hypothetical protein